MVDTYSQDFDVSGMTGSVFIDIHAVVVDDVGCETGEETAWGGGNGCEEGTTGFFTGKNWAIYIEYTLPP